MSGNVPKVFVVPGEKDLPATKVKFQLFAESCTQQGLEFNLSYDDWFDVWVASGKWFKKFNFNSEYQDPHRYMMTVRSQKLPVDKHNVYIISNFSYDLQRKVNGGQDLNQIIADWDMKLDGNATILANNGPSAGSAKGKINKDGHVSEVPDDNHVPIEGCYRAMPITGGHNY